MDSSVFLAIPKEYHILETSSFFVVRDRFPVSPGHSLIISKSLRRDYFELSEAERIELAEAIILTKENIDKMYGPDGYNLVMNCGMAAGQTIFHFHCHVIPRFQGDMINPEGGIRHCIPEKGYYR